MADKRKYSIKPLGLTKEFVAKEIKRPRFPWSRLIVIMLLGLIVLVIYLAVILNQVTIPIRDPYDKTGFIEASQFIKDNGNETIIENENYKFNFNNKDTTFVILDKETNIEYRSNPDTTSGRFLDTLKVYYAGSLGASTVMSVYEKAVEYEDYLIRKDTDSIEILYMIGGKKNVDSSDFPEVIKDVRMQAKILSKLEEGTTAYRRVAEQCYVEGELNGEKVWKLKDGIQTSVLTNLYKIFYEDAGYTVEDLEYDLEQNGIVYEDRYAYVEVSIKYTLTEDGFDIKLINDSIFEKEKFPLLYIDVLPYFGYADLSDEGYTLVPDGSGALIEFNNNRSFALPYNQRIYGKERAVVKEVMENSTEMLNLPLYGMKKNDSGFISIAEEGAEMASIIANVSSVENPYNQAYYRYHFRESEVFQFSSINSSTTIVEWTPFYNINDFNAKVMFVHEDNGSYNGMAKVFQEYLIEKEVLSKKDQTSKVTLDLTLLGGYLIDENFIGIPYTTVKSLTNTDQVKQIASLLVENDVTDINLIYKGWTNDGLKPTYIGKVEYNKVTGSKKDFINLQEYLTDLNINFYPEVLMNTAYTGDNFNENNDAVRNVFNKVVKNHDYNEAILYRDLSTLEYYTLKPTTYENTFESLISSFNKTNFNNVAFNDFGNGLYGSYHKKETLFRTDTLNLFEESLANNSLNFNKTLINNPNLYALKYTDVATYIPTTTTKYQIVGLGVPFYQLVLSGYLDYSAKSFNLDDKYTFNWHKMKAIETGSNINLTWSFESTIDLAETEYSYYYSTYYNNWFDKTIDTYNELNNLGIYSSSLKDHQTLKSDGSITKTTYENNVEIVFNYSVSDYDYNGIIVSPNSYTVIKEATNG